MAKDSGREPWETGAAVVSDIYVSFAAQRGRAVLALPLTDAHADSPEILHVCSNTITDHVYQILFKNTQLRGLTRRSKRQQFHCNAQKKFICKERRPFRHVQTLHDDAHSINQVPHYVSPGSRNVVD